MARDAWRSFLIVFYGAAGEQSDTLEYQALLQYEDEVNLSFRTNRRYKMGNQYETKQNEMDAKDH